MLGEGRRTSPRRGGGHFHIWPYGMYSDLGSPFLAKIPEPG